jgi:hypothetical protein
VSEQARITIDAEFAARARQLMRRCQRGTNNLADAHDIMASAYGTIGRLLAAHEQDHPEVGE